MKLQINIDGGARGNPGPAAAAVVIHRADSNELVHEAGYFLGKATNNVAEYTALLRALAQAVDLGADQVHIQSDSQLMVRQINGEYRVKSADLRPLFEQATTQLKKFNDWKIQHVYREQNHRADELVNLALDLGRDVTMDNHQSPAKSTQWLVKLSGQSSGRCPSDCADGDQFQLGPDTPRGMCIHAARAALNQLAGGLSGSNELLASCAHCGIKLTITPVD